MRETVTEYDVETVEREEERVYCDNCTGECTDTHEVVPRELCPDCQPSEEEREWTLEEYREAFQDEDAKDSLPGLFVALVALFPLFFLGAVLDALDGHEYAKYYFAAVLGFVLWSIIVYGLWTVL